MTDISTLIQTAAAMARSQTVGKNVVLCKAIDRLFLLLNIDGKLWRVSGCVRA